MNRTGYLKRDDSGHWYIIPKDKIDDFRELLNAIENEAGTPEEWDDFCVEFIDKFEEFRVSGGIEDYEVTINE